MRRTLLAPLALAISAGCTSHLENLHADEPQGSRALHVPSATRPEDARPWPTAFHEDVPDQERRNEPDVESTGVGAGVETRDADQPTSDAAPGASSDAASPTTSTETGAGAAGPRRDASDTAVEADETDPLPETHATALGSLGDPRLRRLISDALAQNQNAQAAMARIFQAWSLVDQARSRLMPQISLQGTPTAAHAISPGIGKVDSRGFTASTPVSYEVDIAGRLWLETRATRQEAEARELDLAALDIGIAAEVTEAWLDLVYLNVQRAQLERQLETNERVQDLIDARFRAGIAGETDLLQQKQQVAATHTRLAQLVGLDRIASARLAVLLGRTPEGYAIEVAQEFPGLAELPAEGIAVASVEQRPDVRAAMRRLRAADDRFLIAARQYLPTLVLNGAAGWQILHAERAGFSATQSGFVWNAGATLTQPLFQGLRNVAVQGQRRAQVDELIATYEQTMITALAEVESALALEGQQRALLVTLEAQRANAAELRESAESQYRAGITDFLTVFVAVQQEQTAELALVAAQRDLYSARVQLIRALGGDVTGPTPHIR